MSKASISIANLRGFVIVLVLAFHSCVPYLTSQPQAQPAFETGAWLADPIVDSARWLPLDLFSAFQFLYLMQLLFFLSGLFTWTSLQRKGAAAFLRDRAVRLGVPFLFGTCLLMPASYYAVYRVTAADPSLPAFWLAWTRLPFWPNGPMWFLWFLLVLDFAAVGLYQFARPAVNAAARLTTSARAKPGRFLVALFAVSALVYLPSALVFSPWQWTEFGPFALQPGFAPQYVIYFFAGLLVGANGLENSFLNADGNLARRWGLWAAGALASFIVWLIAMAIIVKGPVPHLPGVQFTADVAIVSFVGFAVFAATALSLRLVNERRPYFKSLGENSYGIYVFHYFFLLWSQYFLLAVTMFALIKAVIVFTVTLALSWTVSVAVCQIPTGARLLRGERPIGLKKDFQPRATVATG